MGLVGLIGAGKTTVSDFLISKGFHHLRFSAPIEIEIKKRGLPLERKIYQDIGDEWRTKFGLDYISRLLLQEVEKSSDSHFIVDGFRNLGEINPFMSLESFFLIGLVADAETRYQRLRKRGKPGDPHTKRDFLKQEKRDVGARQPDFFGQNNSSVLELADVKINTAKNLDEVLKEVEEILEEKGFIGSPSLRGTK